MEKIRSWHQVYFSHPWFVYHDQIEHTIKPTQTIDRLGVYRSQVKLKYFLFCGVPRKNAIKTHSLLKV